MFDVVDEIGGVLMMRGGARRRAGLTAIDLRGPEVHRPTAQPNNILL